MSAPKLLLTNVEFWAKSVLVSQAVQPNDAVVELFCRDGPEVSKWERLPVRLWTAVDPREHKIDLARRRWHDRGEKVPAEFVHALPLERPITQDLPVPPPHPLHDRPTASTPASTTTLASDASDDVGGGLWNDATAAATAHYNNTSTHSSGTAMVGGVVDARGVLVPPPGHYDVVVGFDRLQWVWESERMARQYLANVAAALRPGGRFIGVCVDSAEVWRRMQKVEGREWTNPVMTVEMATREFRPFGTHCRMRWGKRDNEQRDGGSFLVHFETMIALCAEYGLALVSIMNLQEMLGLFAKTHAESLARYKVTQASMQHKAQMQGVGLLASFVFVRQALEWVPDGGAAEGGDKGAGNGQEARGVDNNDRYGDLHGNVSAPAQVPAYTPYAAPAPAPPPPTTVPPPVQAVQAVPAVPAQAASQFPRQYYEHGQSHERSRGRSADMDVEEEGEMRF